MAAILELRGVDTFYGPVQVHFGVSLTVREGEITCLLGGNASGKSTAMKVILGLVRPRGGQVLLGGEDATRWPTPRRIRWGLGSVPEARRLFPHMTVRENLLMGAYARTDREQVRADYEMVLELFPRVRERLSQVAGTLSGGEQQMVAMARALMGRPRLLCMDEPTMGLSPLWVDRVLELIRQVNARGTTVFMVEQNARAALQIAHRGYVLQNGVVRLEGTAAELAGNPLVEQAYLGGRSA
ncbi:ABC transporter ATP-binding protein [Symbiobacterium thermophilum]|uniref:ABC transporter ATP-binding protein n=2 Tax=Symbiobacterium thermophilum TaxID=2734 RepID=Q67LV3_SYMTH|nr:ABC transporter ATP-binding protein [Symbiobacterium thermophilum]MBY6275269.1 ABC transporter ATP-binding protein [Symbiobacterium thermophilum]BAD41343.1 ABC transporter ATP-binding protein [Symbiobacterium thermophilum IAM 14863]